MNFNDINPYLRYAESQPSVFQGGCLRKAYDCRIFYALSGKGILHINNKSISFKAGNIAFMPFDYPYYFEGEIYIIVLNLDFNRDSAHIPGPAQPVPVENFKPDKIFNQALPETFQSPIVLSNYPEAETVVTDILQEYRFPNKLSEAKCSGLLKTLICDIAKSAFQPNDKFSLEKQLISYIKDNCTSSVSNEEIAEHFGYNHIYLNRIFKAYSGMSIHKYLLSERLKLSEKLLRGTDLSIEEIAEKCGFSERSRFCTTFKKQIGKTPLEYRNQL